MIRVTMEIVPFGDESLKCTIGTMIIARQQAHANPCDYTVRVDRPQAEFMVEQHVYEDGAWELVHRAVANLVTGYRTNRG